MTFIIPLLIFSYLFRLHHTKGMERTNLDKSYSYGPSLIFKSTRVWSFEMGGMIHDPNQFINMFIIKILICVVFISRIIHQSQEHSSLLESELGFVLEVNLPSLRLQFYFIILSWITSEYPSKSIFLLFNQDKNA